MEREHDGHTPGQGRNSARTELAAVEIMTVNDFGTWGELKYLRRPGKLKIFQAEARL